MKYIILLIAFCQPVAAVTFSDCAILSRHSSPSGALSKIYECGSVVVRLLGSWQVKPDSNGVLTRREFGEFWFGETADFGAVAQSAIRHVFTNCVGGGLFGVESNFAGYMTERITFSCADGEVKLEGQWGEEYQGHWVYTLQLGEVHTLVQWVDDAEKTIDFSAWQKYCKTKYGYRLCGWVEEPKVDHGKPPRFKRD